MFSIRIYLVAETLQLSDSTIPEFDVNQCFDATHVGNMFLLLWGFLKDEVWGVFARLLPLREPGLDFSRRVADFDEAKAALNRVHVDQTRRFKTLCASRERRQRIQERLFYESICGRGSRWIWIARSLRSGDRSSSGMNVEMMGCNGKSSLEVSVCLPRSGIAIYSRLKIGNRLAVRSLSVLGVTGACAS